MRESGKANGTGMPSDVHNIANGREIRAASFRNKLSCLLSSDNLSRVCWIDGADIDGTFQSCKKERWKCIQKHIYKLQATSNPTHNFLSLLRKKSLCLFQHGQVCRTVKVWEKANHQGAEISLRNASLKLKVALEAPFSQPNIVRFPCWLYCYVSFGCVWYVEHTSTRPLRTSHCTTAHSDSDSAPCTWYKHFQGDWASLLHSTKHF